MNSTLPSRHDKVALSNIELRDAVVECLKDSNKTLSIVEILYLLLTKNHIPGKYKAKLKLGHIRETCESLAKEGVLIEKEKGKFAYNQCQKVESTENIEIPSLKNESSAHEPEKFNALEMIRDFAGHKTIKKLASVNVFNFFNEEQKRGKLLKETLVFDIFRNLLGTILKFSDF